MGAPPCRRVWVKRADAAVYVGTFTDPAGMTACVFADARTGRAIGPLNLQLGERTRWSFPAPRVGPPPDVEPGRQGQVEYYRVEWTGSQKGPDREPRGVFLRFEEGPDSRHLPTLAADPFLLGLLGDPERIAALQEHELAPAFRGLILGRHETLAKTLAARLPLQGAYHAPRAIAGLVFDGLPGLAASGYLWPGSTRKPVPVTATIPPSAVRALFLSPPGILKDKEHDREEGYPDPDAGPFESGGSPIHHVRAAGVEAWRSLLRALHGAREIGEAIALGVDAAGRALALVDGRLERFLDCSLQAKPRFGDVLLLQTQGDRLGWAEPLGRNDAAKAVDLLRGLPCAPLLARAAEEGHASWDAWERGMPDDADLRGAVLVNPSIEHARRLERRLPGAGDGRRKLGAVLGIVAAYWRAGAFDDARILLGRMPNLLPETQDAPVLRASKFLHALLEGRPAHDARQEDLDELSYVWDGTLGPIAQELGQAFAGRCVEALDNAGL